MDIEWTNKILTILIIVLIIVEILHLIFSVYSYYFLRNKQFSPCKKGEYRGGRN
jgi:hypothetical protein